MSNVFLKFVTVSYVFSRILQVVTSEILNTSTSAFETNCSSLQMGQYLCNPEIDPLTQQLKGCSRNNIANSKLFKKRKTFVLVYMQKARMITVFPNIK